MKYRKEKLSLLFSSPVFILIFLPIAVAIYFLLNRQGYSTSGKLWLVFASLFFYGYWNPVYLLLIGVSILANFAIGNQLRSSSKHKKKILYLGIFFNLGLLGYFKYADFFIANVNWILSTQIPELNVVLPLAISFFTFQQIAYLVDTYKGTCEEHDFLSYCLFVSFFPQLIAGPIVHHKEMMPQFSDPTRSKLNLNNISMGTIIFTIGLFKKVILADSLSQYADPVFSASLTHNIDFIPAWLASFAYTFQLYFDFSGYCDMAIGAALLLNIHLPVNFHSPYKALNIQDFWRRWHMTLSRWFRDYVYINLGGNRIKEIITLRNVFLTAFVSGIWHGAGWTFVLWGTAHGLAMVIHRIYSKSSLWQLPRWLAWFSTFMFVNLAWVLFRAESLGSALNIYRGMINVDSLSYPHFIEFHQQAQNILTAPPFFESILGLYWIAIAGSIAFFGIWSNRLGEIINASDKRDLLRGLVISILGFTTLVSMGNQYSAFIYFNF
ncbi:MBOAT family O-acyltransferase [Paraneptunicella aestuarii]|uniref:MBOAT family O-acyltransferase n=1 Tax=Paraneptunicella aestuarii TaxID=2831148 RepID=UPI001E43729A|nr:MBOAT family protein [Paraneptunicella aestuarii]